MNEVVVVLSIMASIAGSFIIRDLYNCLPLIAKVIARWRAKKIPQEHRQKLYHACLADIENSPSGLYKIYLALTFGYNKPRNVPNIKNEPAPYSGDKRKVE